MNRHPDLGDPEASIIFQHSMQRAENERKIREAEEAAKLRWNPLGRWSIVKTTQEDPHSAVIIEQYYLLIDSWFEHSSMHQFTKHKGFGKMLKCATREKAIAEAEKSQQKDDFKV